MWDKSLKNPLKGSVELLPRGLEAGICVDVVDEESLSSKRSKHSFNTSLSKVMTNIKQLDETTQSFISSQSSLS